MQATLALVASLKELFPSPESPKGVHTQVRGRFASMIISEHEGNLVVAPADSHYNALEATRKITGSDCVQAVGSGDVALSRGSLKVSLDFFGFHRTGAELKQLFERSAASPIEVRIVT